MVPRYWLQASISGTLCEWFESGHNLLQANSLTAVSGRAAALFFCQLFFVRLVGCKPAEQRVGKGFGCKPKSPARDTFRRAACRAKYCRSVYIWVGSDEPSTDINMGFLYIIMKFYFVLYITFYFFISISIISFNLFEYIFK